MKLVKIASHPINGKLFRKLSDIELDFITEFIKRHDESSDDEFMEKANRLFIDEKYRPKNHVDMWSIIIQCK